MKVSLVEDTPRGVLVITHPPASGSGSGDGAGRLEEDVARTSEGARLKGTIEGFVPSVLRLYEIKADVRGDS